MKKFVSIFFAVLIAVSCFTGAFALSLEDGMEALQQQFVFGEGPVVGEYSIDYRYFSPVKENDNAKYPLVVWLHGMGDGAEDGVQVSKSNIACWASDEFQARFEPAGGAFILAARSREENGNFWGEDLIEPLRTAIDSFIAEHKENIDLSRIYIGGYSMGGKMTLNMAVAYPEMFAAIFPICPAWAMPKNMAQHLADIPVWLVSGKSDPLVNYNLSVNPTWSKITANSNVAEECRFSTLAKVCYPNGERTSSSHHAWFAVNNDLFSDENGDYPYMTTVNGKGETVTLEYPNGMISWLTSHTSDYDGTPCKGKGNLEGAEDTGSMFSFENLEYFFRNLFAKLAIILPC